VFVPSFDFQIGTLLQAYNFKSTGNRTKFMNIRHKNEFLQFASDYASALCPLVLLMSLSA